MHGRVIPVSRVSDFVQRGKFIFVYFPLRSFRVFSYWWMGEPSFTSFDPNGLVVQAVGVPPPTGDAPGGGRARGRWAEDDFLTVAN